MKKNIILSSILLIGILACTKIEENQKTMSNDYIRFHADVIETKTNIADGTDGTKNIMVWSAGDKIGVFDAEGFPQIFVSEKGGATTDFIGNASKPLDKWYAFYPYSSKATIKEGMLETLIPEVQYAHKDGVSDNVTVLYASTETSSSSLSFNHACALLKLIIPEPVVSVTLETYDVTDVKNAALSGTINVDCVNNVIAPGNICYPSVTLVAENAGEIPAGIYYLAIRPIDFSGTILLTLRNKENKIYVSQKNKMKVGAGQVLPMKIVPEWIEDDGTTVYAEVGKNVYKGLWGEWEQSDGVKTGKDYSKVYGKQSTEWTFLTGKAWGDRLGFQTDKGFSLDNYIDKGYALEFFVKCDQSVLDLEYSDNIFTVWFKLGKQCNGSWNTDGKNYPETIMKRSTSIPSTNVVCDTGWHRMSIPIISKIFGSTQWLWQIILDPRFVKDTPDAVNANMYIDEARVVRKAATSK